MTLDEIDHLFDVMAKEAADQGDSSLLPGAVMMSVDSYCRIPHGSPIACKKILDGIRYRKVRVNVSSAYEDKVLNRAEAGASGEPYFDLEPKV